MEFEADDYIEVSSFDNLAFVISKRTAVRLLSLSNAEPHKSWSEFFLESVIRTFSCSPKSKARVYVFKDIWGSQNTYQHQLSISDFSPNVCDTPDSNVISNSNVHAFVSHWHSTWDNVCSVQAACEEFGYKTDILNSTEIQINGWINDVPIEYFGQIEAACQAFDENHDFLLFIQADHKTTFWTDYFAHVSPYLNFATTGTIAPTVTNNLFRRSLFPKATFNRRDHLSVFPNNDINVIYIRKEIVLKLRDFFSFFHATQNWKPSLGAGVVDLMNHICSDLDLVHLRDYCYSFMNPFSRGWSEGGANELMPLLKIATNFMGNSVESVVNNFDKVSGNYYHPNKF